MTTLNHLPLLLAGLVFVGPHVLAAGPAEVAAGKQKAAACASCHGDNGHSKNNQWPNLAGQHPAYLLNQLLAFKSGQRVHPMMQAVAAGLTEADIADLSAYFSSLPPVSAGGDPLLAKAGAEKAAMCMGCHGQKGEGHGPIPRLAGQQPEYLATQLRNFKDGTRKGGPMQAMAAGLTDEDIEALAAYFASL